MSTVESPRGAAQPPEPGLTPGEMVARARALRPRLVEEQAATEERSCYSPEMHEAFLAAGFYHLYVPRRYGGYEFDVPTYARVIKEISRGCVSTGWGLGLCMNHALQVASWWPQSAQDAIFAGGDFRGGSVAAPVGPATRTADGWEINGEVAFASGSPYGTFYMGQALLPQGDPAAPPGMLLFVAPRSEWEMLDDWGDLLGLRGSGSNTLRFDRTRIPADWAFEAFMVDIPVDGGTHGSRLHGNPMYSGRGMTIFTLSLAAVTVGGVLNALDEYERLLRTKSTPLPPFGRRVQDREHQKWFGRAVTKAKVAEMVLDQAAAEHMERCRANVEDGVDYSYGDDMTLAATMREVIINCWDIVNEDLWQTVGASVARDGERMPRIFRDMAIAVAHRNAQQRDLFYGEVGRAALGEPRIPFGE
jgi:3-hydroxy-9,10-secoandrosta-1,3,5(10)-triene-9,17-dione monooxygenase